jgi:hypothetical protein
MVCSKCKISSYYTYSNGHASSVSLIKTMGYIIAGFLTVTG